MIHLYFFFKVNHVISSAPTYSPINPPPLSEALDNHLFHFFLSFHFFFFSAHASASKSATA